jgi:hypothetical protein
MSGWIGGSYSYSSTYSFSGHGPVEHKVSDQIYPTQENDVPKIAQWALRDVLQRISKTAPD